MGKKITIQDIAEELGVSRNTVSKAINNGSGIADATRERILRKAVEMGYKQFSYLNTVSSISAPREPDGAAKEIALLTTVFLNHSHFASVMLDSFQQEISLLGYTMNTHRIREEHLATRSLPATFHREHAAAILCIEVFDRPYAEMICSLGLPVLFVDAPVCDGDFLPADQLYMENASGIIKLVRDLIQTGKRRIGFIGNYMHCQSFFERYAAFRCAMRLSGVPVEETDCLKCDGYDEIREKLRDMRSLPEVFLCANDFVAMDALRVLREMGKTVPDDIWLCGFDDSPESRMMTPPLTTIHIHTQIMTFSAVHLLMSRIKEPNLDYRAIHTQTELIWRESTGNIKLNINNINNINNKINAEKPEENA